MLMAALEETGFTPADHAFYPAARQAVVDLGIVRRRKVDVAADIGPRDITQVVIGHPLVAAANTKYGSSQVPDVTAIRAIAAKLFSTPGTAPVPWPTPKPGKSPKPTPKPSGTPGS